jgi:hypothetical protein
MPERNLALRRRVAPFTKLELLLEEPGGGHIPVELKLAFNMNAGVAVQEKTRSPQRPEGLMLTDFGMWAHILEPKVLRAVLWAASLAHQPEYDTGDDEGLETIGSFIDERNSEQIFEALWAAYLNFLPAPKRDMVVKLRTEAEKKRPEGETNGPLGPEAAPMVPIAPPRPSTGSSSGPSDVTISSSAMTSSAV